ncbi:MAG TPA: transcription termination factor NusA [Candidatus Merdibacter merdavium]|uniref:Transcription termination/antitermination protein NusA n=1 Tax=Candidatus Merdibacter merdavium TaxID=2838692 RepID=A0A9D2NTS2_9FIRM|nr:transcription termination factor NusA [Candidatus Merdibacter merdavium]
MKLKMFMDAMQAIENDRKLTKEIVVSALEEALIKAYRKHIEIPDALVRVDISEKTGAIRVFQERQVVENVEDDEMEISLEDAQRINKDYQLGDLVDEEVNIQEFGRAAVVLAKNVMKQKIREAEKQIVYEEYCDKVEEMITGTIETVEEKFCIVNIGKTLAMMPKNQQMPNEKYREGERIRVVIIEVNKETKGAQVLVSRADATLVKRLFEKEVPEIYQGIIEIKAIAREAGERTKMAVYSHNENIDPIGACIGPRGQRVQVVIDELHGEKIDIFEWSEDVSELIKNALSPAEVLGVIPSEEKKGGLLVIVPDHQLSLAIGKRGKNARLAVKLTGRKIDIKAESEVNEAGIDWRGIAAAQHEEFLRRQEEERARRQQELFASSNEDNEIASVEDADFDYNDEPAEEENMSQSEEQAQPEAAAAPVEAAPEKPQPKEERASDDFEEAARIAKAKQKEKGIDLREKQEYTSKFEALADASASHTADNRPSRPSRKKNERDEEKRRPTFDPSNLEYEFKPIYTEEELAEIERQEEEERENDWINNDIDFDEYDKYYD